LSVPSSALIFDARGLSIATVNANNRVVVKPVTIERDLGTTIEVASGLTPSDRVIENPPDGISNGTQVNVPRSQPVSAVAGRTGNAKDGHEKS
jgi:multidrug efflux pump subunit AcrA (membrane-fusion protein)